MYKKVGSSIVIILIFLIVFSIPISISKETDNCIMSPPEMKYHIIIRVVDSNNVSLPNIPFIFRLSRLSAHNLYLLLPFFEFLFTNETGVFDNHIHYDNLTFTAIMYSLEPGMIIRFMEFHPWYGYCRTDPIILKSDNTEINIVMKLQ